MCWLDAHNGAVTAVATIAIALFTIALVYVSKFQAKLTRAALELGNKEFISTHRPKLRVRRFHAHIDEGSLSAISYVLVNVGGSAAHIKKLEITMMVPLQGGKELLPELLPQEPRTLAGGESYLFIAKAAKLIEHGWRRNIEIKGIIDYADDAKVNRQTGFWRIRNPDTGRFAAKDDPDYEYED
jgi:hypothetical protein